MAEFNDDDFVSVSGNSDIWNPTVDENKQDKMVSEPDDFIVGYYIGMKENVGMYNKSIVRIRKTDGSEVGVWANSVLEDNINKIAVGSFVKITYTGMKLKAAAANKKQAEIKSTDYYKTWDVAVNAKVPKLDIAPQVTQASTPAAGTSAPSTNVFEKRTASRADMSTPPTGSDDLPF